MLHYLRQIRQKLIIQDNARKYLLYAIGEILLVVIGILIALQVSNWNQSRHNNTEEIILLTKLESNITNDAKSISQRLILIENFTTALELIKKEMNDETLDKFSVNIANAILASVDLALETTTWDNLKSSDNLNLIRNRGLVDSLSLYYTNFNSVSRGWNAGFMSYSRNIIAPEIFQFDDFLLFAPSSYANTDSLQLKPPREYKKETFFRNAVRFRLTALQSIHELYEANLARSNRLLDSLRKELEEKSDA